MKRQARPFIVEVKHKKRGNLKRGHSIWGDLDLSTAVAEPEKMLEENMVPKHQVVDSDEPPIDAEDGNRPRAEYLMADPKETESVQIPSEVTAAVEAPEAKKKVQRTKAAKAQPERSSRKAASKSAPAEVASSATVRKARKIYSKEERGRLLSQIEKAIGRGESIKNATGRAGISEQTYYQWKKAAPPASESGGLKDLVALEEENTRLKGLLAERLRKENAELKKKLGMG